jgi:DNA-binding response OmpR family regulator
MALIHIIDDDVTVLSSLVDLLSAEGFNITTSNTLESGLVAVTEHRPDLLILEVRCGDGAGWQALEQIAPLMAVMVLSGAAREEDIVRGFDYGAIDYLAKPYRSGELLARVRIRVAASVERAPNRNASQGISHGYNQRPEPAGQGSAMASAFAKLQGLKK